MKKTSAAVKKSSMKANAGDNVDTSFREMLGAVMGRYGNNFLFQGNRDLYAQCGYTTDPKKEDFENEYEKSGIAARIVDLPADDCWKTQPVICEDEGVERTEAELKVDNVFTSAVLFPALAQADKLSGICGYSVIYLGLNDSDDVSLPVIRSPSLQLVYCTVYKGTVVTVDTYETNIKNSRYGMPLKYQIRMKMADGNEVTKTVHWERVLHIISNKEGSKIQGIPRLQKVFNYVSNVEKILGSSAEGVYRAAIPGTSFEQDATSDDMSTDQKKEFNTMVQMFTNNLTRVLRLKGIKANQLTVNTVDPTTQFEIQISAISISTRIPKRILVGSEQAQYSSTQDKANWNVVVNERRTNFVIPYIIKYSLSHLIYLGLIDKMEYSVKWGLEETYTEKERSEIQLNETKTLVEYSGSAEAQSIVPVQMFLRKFMRFSAEEVEAIEAEAGGFTGDEE